MARRAFTLIELLVVISVIALLISILLPALAGARRAGATARELAELRSVGGAYAAYSHDNRDRLLPGYLLSPWAGTGPSGFVVHDSAGDGSEESRLTGSIIRPYP